MENKSKEHGIYIYVKMDSVIEIQTWCDAVHMYEIGDIQGSISKFLTTSLNAKIVFNIGCCLLAATDKIHAKQVFIILFYKQNYTIYTDFCQS